MNNGAYNAPNFHLSTVAVESMCQQSTYQQRTYVDRTRIAVTDVFVREQRSWSMSTPTVQMRAAPVFVQTARAAAGTCAYMGGSAAAAAASAPAHHHHHQQHHHHPTTAQAQTPPLAQAPQQQQQQRRFNYMSMPGMQYYASSSSSMSSYGHTYVQHSATSANMSGLFVPPCTHAQMRAQQPQCKEAASQTAVNVKRCCDAATQTDLIGDAPPMAKLRQQGEHKRASSLESFWSQGVPQAGRRNSEVVLPMQRLHDLTRISLQGSDIAERLANAHRQRPCFKKMDTLCARLKQDLLRPDGVLPNINSQGIAWAVKDFIFVFTRIVNSWVILKGYVYNTPEGLNKIKDELPMGFMAAFDCWQVTSLALVELIIKSFVNLDSMLQKQKNSFSKTDSNNNWSSNDNSSDSNSSNKTIGYAEPAAPDNIVDASPSAHSTPQAKPAEPRTSPSTENKPKYNLDLNYLYTMIQDSEEAQRCVNANGTYLKTGTYTPLRKDGNPLEQYAAAQLPAAAQWKFKQQKQPADCQPKLAKRSKLAEDQANLLAQEMARMLYDLSNRILKLESIDRFFQKQFTRNYYPYFFERCHLQFIDVRAIVLKCESAAYQHIYQPIHDLRRIIYLVRNDLKEHTNMDLRLYTALYERAVNSMLTTPPYMLQHFEHITGRPGEQLFNFVA
ncbi:protein mitoshell isoform X2 [Drosophila busckii]|uniref:protein mitoshell isoform X2 n=1 Tax=Drosophila busckii TaxID=30019 RepID=UPI00083EED1A|nr:protein mitoshell isoform X2 [Drosophila busckii]